MIIFTDLLNLIKEQHGKIYFLPTSKLKITRLRRQQGFLQKMVNIRPKLK
jgi:hypothetical protein